MKFISVIMGLMLAFAAQAAGLFGLGQPAISQSNWAGLPPAASNLNVVYQVTDQNGSLWTSNGAYWRPVNGHHTILHSYVNFTFTGTASQETALAASAVIPGNMLPANCMVEVTLFVDGITNNTDAKNFRIRWGTSAVAQSATSFGTNTPIYLNNPTSTVSGRLQAAIYPLNATNSQLTAQTNGYGTSGTSVPTASSIDTTTGTSANTYLTPTINLATSTDSVTLVAWTVEIIYP